MLVEREVVDRTATAEFSAEKAKIVRCPITKSSGKELRHNCVTAWKYLLAICLRGF